MPTSKKLTRTPLAAAMCLMSLTTTTTAQEQETAKDDLVEEVLVMGIRSALNRAIDVKRNAATVVDAISAEDIGKLPDVTISDALQRISGVQIRRDAGEGTTVNVRGTPQVAMFLNGEQFLSASAIDTAQPDFADVPAELLSGVEVIKSSEAKTLAGGMSATVNLKSRRPFDLDEGWLFGGSAEATDGSYTDDMGHKVVAFGSYRNDTIGGLITMTQSSAKMANYRYGMYNDWWFRGYHENGDWPGPSSPRDITRDGDTNDTLFGTIDYGVTNRTSERDRIGLSGTLQFQPSETLEFIADVFYTDMDQYQRANGLIADNAWSNYDWITPIELTNRGRGAEGRTDEDFYTTDHFTLDALRITAKAESRVEKRESLNTNFQANFKFTDTFSGSARYIHADAENYSTLNIADANITSGEQHGLSSRVNGVEAPVHPNGYGPDRVPVEVRMSGTHPEFIYPENFAQDIDRYALVSTFSEGNVDEEASLDVLRFDGKLEFGDNSMEFGYRFGNRDISRTEWDYVAPFTRNNASGEPVTAYAKWKDSGIAIEDPGGDTIARTWSFSELQDMGYVHQVSDFGPANTSGSYYFINPETLDDAYGFQESLYPGNVKATYHVQSYDIKESNHTLYWQANLNGEIGIPYSANFGLQVVRTFLDIDQRIAAPDNSTITVDDKEYIGISGTRGPATSNRETKRDYTDILPRFNIAFDLNDDMKLRMAYTKTMTQLSANDLGLGLYLTYNRNTELEVFEVVSGSQNGNPEMKPWRSNNFDLSYEWYFSDTSILNAGVFYIDVEEYIGNSAVVIQGIPDSDGVVRNNGISVTTRDNIEGGSIQGLELAYQQAFENLPGILQGLGTTLNFTYAEGTGGDKDFYGSEMPIPDYSENQLNAILWYDYEGFQARIAYNYRSERYLGRPWNDGHPAAWWSTPTSYVDIAFSYDFLDNYTVYFQGSNITEEFEETYMQWEDVIVNQNVYEARYALGIRAKF